MARGPARFKQRDVTRVLKAAQAAGLPVKEVKVVNDGTIVVVAGRPETTPYKEEAAPNEWDGAK